VEVNASDTRNKSDAKVKAGIGGKLSNAVRELATNSAIGAGADGRPKRVGRWSSFIQGCCGSGHLALLPLVVSIRQTSFYRRYHLFTVVAISCLATRRTT
jgi:hypothetical protein